MHFTFNEGYDCSNQSGGTNIKSITMARRGAQQLKGKAYRASKIRERNKLRKLAKHITHNPSDNDAVHSQKMTLAKLAA